MGSTYRRNARANRAAALLMLVAVPLASGCYTYRGADRTELGAGTEVRAHLAPEAVQEVRRISGREFARLEGRIEDADAENIILRTRLGASPAGPARQAFGQRLVLPLNQVRFLEIRELNRGRTALLVSAATAAIVASVVLAFNGRSGGSRRDPGPSPQVTIGRR